MSLYLYIPGNAKKGTSCRTGCAKRSIDMHIYVYTHKYICIYTHIYISTHTWKCEKRNIMSYRQLCPTIGFCAADSILKIRKNPAASSSVLSFSFFCSNIEKGQLAMRWLRLVGSLNYRSLLQKHPIKETIFCKRNL